MIDLRGQVAIVTGGASGIGRATSLALSRCGVRVVIVDVTQAKIDATLSDLAGAVGPAMGLRLDVSSESDMEQMAGRVLDRFGRIDILVSCAGILRPAGTSPTAVANLPLADWDRIMDVNLRGAFLSNRAVLGPMLSRGRGQIVNVSSVFGRKGKAFDNAYCASKAGLIGLSEALAEEVRQHGLRVYTLLPDSVDTPLWDQNPIPRATAALPADHVGEFITHMLAMPENSMLVNPIIAPFSPLPPNAPGPRDAAHRERLGSRVEAR